MVRRTLTAALVLSLSLPALVSSREPPRIDRCAENGGWTVLANRSVRLYVIRTSLGNNYLRNCWIPTGRTSDLAASGAPVRDLLPELRIAGRYLAFASIDFDRKQPTDPGVWLTVAVRDVKRDGCVLGFLANPPDSDLSYRYVDSRPGVTDLELTSQGGVAWIVSGRPNRDDYFYVQKVDAGGRAVLDEGPSIDPTSLAISGRRIYWMSGGVPRSATLDGLARDEDCAGSRPPSSRSTFVTRRTREYRIDRCADNGGRTLVASRSVRVYATTGEFGNKYLRYCWIPSGRTSTLASAVERPRRIAGRYLAQVGEQWDTKQPIDDGVVITLAVRDVKRDRCIVAFYAQPPEPEPGLTLSYADADPGVTDFELSRAGALTWIVSGRPNRDDYFYVQKADAGGQVVLDEGPSIDPRSLALTGRRIYWMNGGVPRSAVLDGRARDEDCP